MEQLLKLFELLCRYQNIVIIATIYGSVYGFYLWLILNETRYELKDSPTDYDADKLLKGVINFTMNIFIFIVYVFGGGLLCGLFVAGFPVTFPVYYYYKKKFCQLRRK